MEKLVLSITFTKNASDIAHNVPAVCEGFYGAIKETEGFQRHKNFGWSGAWEAKPT
jgi:hypothetical protein